MGNPRITRDECAAIIAMYLEGKSLRAIAATLNRSQSGVRQILLAAQIRLRPRGGQEGSTRPRRPKPASHTENS
jgi:transposase